MPLLGGFLLASPFHSRLAHELPAKFPLVWLQILPLHLGSKSFLLLGFVSLFSTLFPLIPVLEDTCPSPGLVTTVNCRKFYIFWRADFPVCFCPRVFGLIPHLSYRSSPAGFQNCHIWEWTRVLSIITPWQPQQTAPPQSDQPRPETSWVVF